MKTLSVLGQLIGGCDRARVVRELADSEVASLVDRLLERGRVLDYVDERELLLLLVQRFDFALLDLQLANLYRRTPNLLEPVLEDRIRERIMAILGEEPNSELVGVLVRRTKAAARRMDNIGTHRDDAVVLEAAVGGNGQLRCAYCGYHFLETDVRPSLRSSANLDGTEFATSIHPRRAEDEWKPIRSKTNQGDFQGWTELQIEHRVPHTALGENTRENLTVACKWCNRGKRAYQSYAEALPTLLTVSLGKLHLAWAIDHVARAFYTVINREGACAKCSVQAADRELTVQVNGTPAGLRRPFEISTVCYECWKPM